MDVRIGGGPNTIQQYLREGLIDELHIAIAPVLLGRGEPLFEGVDLRAMGYLVRAGIIFGCPFTSINSNARETTTTKLSRTVKTPAARNEHRWPHSIFTMSRKRFTA